MDTERLLSDRARSIDASGIRKVFQLGAKLHDPINLSIGQPDFPVPDAIRASACAAIEAHANGYTQTQGDPVLLERTADHLRADLGWEAAPAGSDAGDAPRLLITSGTSGALALAFMTLLSPGDECVIPDPYFVAYPHLATLAGARAVRCDTYPDFRMTAARVEPLLTEKTKFVLLNAPSNPTGTVLTTNECRELRELCASRGVLLISDEIYDEFTFDEFRTDRFAGDPLRPACPSPARAQGAHESVLLIRGFGKTYACTGWRLGYVCGAAPIVEAMARLQQYTFVCAPAPLQIGVAESFGVDMSAHVGAYKARRDRVVEALSDLTEVVVPGGAFYAFVRVPESLGMSGSAFVERAIERNVLVIPGGVFSSRDTHIRISFATRQAKLEAGLEILREMMAGG